MARVRSSSRPAKAVTILDIARRAGVSTATVSRALAAPERVAAKTRAAVETAIAETGYTPNVSARNLRARTTRMVLALLPGMSNSFFTPILNAIEDVLSEAGYGMIIGDTRNSPLRERHYARLIRAGQVDGVILFTGHLPRDEGHTVSAAQVPIALVCNEIPGEASFPVFDAANRDAARAAVSYLIDLGHRRIGLIKGPEGNVEGKERLKGYGEALAAAKIPVAPELIWPGDFRYETGVAAGEAFLRLDDRPSAVFATSDDMAIGFMKTVKDAGVAIPEDVSVVGFDDIEYAPVIDPPLTTMRQPRAEIGRRAAIDLLKRMDRGAPNMRSVHVRLACELIVRESAARTVAQKATASRPRAQANARAARGRRGEATAR